MAKFIFELKVLLAQRRREEQERMKAVAEIERERVEIEQSALRLAAEMRAEREVLRQELEGKTGVDLGSVRQQANASLHGIRKTHELALQGAATVTKLEGVRRELLEATTRRRAVELLRDRRFEAWLAAERAKEAREIDELVTARFGKSTAHDGAQT